MIKRPRGLLFDYGGTLVEEVAFDRRAGIELLLAHSVERRAGVSPDEIIERAERVTREVADRRDQLGIETPWASLTRLIHDYFGTRFDAPLAELELAFWNAAVQTRPMPGVREALDAFQRSGIAMGVVSNTLFGHNVIRHELAKHDLADYMAFVIASADYAVRKPDPLLLEVAAARLGVPRSEVWFVGDRLDTDVRGARAAGMTAVWFGPDAGTQHPDADLHAATWGDVAGMVRAAAAAVSPTVAPVP